MNFLILIIIFFIFFAFNEIYNFLPKKTQRSLWSIALKFTAVLVILGYGIYPIIQKHNARIYAYISSKDCTKLAEKNFPWQVYKITHQNKETIYTIRERYGDASDVSIILDEPNKENKKYEIALSGDGMFIKFFCSEDNISNFIIKIKN